MDGNRSTDRMTGTTKPNDGIEIAYGVSCSHEEAAGTYENAIVPTGAETQGNYKVTYVPEIL